MHIRELNPADDADIDGWLALDGAVTAERQPDLPPPCRQELVGALRQPWPGVRTERWLASDGDRLVGQLQVLLPTMDNLDTADLILQVHPEARRRGVGRELFGHAAERARAAGRHVLHAESVAGLAEGEARRVPGALFAGSVGAKLANLEVRRRLDLDTADTSGYAAMLADAEAHAGGYALRQWVGAVPDDIVAGLAPLLGEFNEEAPHGDLGIENERIDVDRIRGSEATQRAQGVRTYSTAARHVETGEVVAYSQIEQEHCPEDHAWQNITLVLPAHRGHRLGLLTKLANLELARRERPALRVIDTWNAEQNGPMIGINEAIGFRARDVEQFWRLDLDH